jgi:protein-histidine pros-kinase
LFSGESEPADTFRGLLEAAPDAMVIVGGDGRIALVNGQTERLFGYRREELLGQPVDLLVPERLRPGHAGHRASYFGDPRTRPMGGGRELLARRKDGSEFPAEISLSPMHAPRGLLVTAAIRDASTRKKAERALVEASRMKSEFLANMSHELRTPLNAIIGFAELIHDGQVPPGSPQLREFVGDILASGRHLLQLINDVLDLAKVEAGKLELRPEEVDVAELVREVCATLRASAAEKKLRLEASVEPGLSGVVLDPRRLRQVLLNYLSNALKFTPSGGRVTARVRPREGDTLLLEVEDTGIGISPEDQARLFVEFQQLDAGAAKRHAGTGLGLALTRRIVELQGGAVGVRSAVGRGSVFFAVLPRRARGPAAAEGERT